MSQFEFLAAGASILFALTLGRTLTAAPYLFREGVFDPLYTFMYGVFFLWQLALWWTLWENSVVAHWNFLGFVLLIATPLAYYLVSLFLIPNAPENVESWKAHYDDVRTVFAALFAFSIAIGRTRHVYLQPDDAGPIGFFITLSVIVIAVGAIFTANRWYHWFFGVILTSFISFRLYFSSAGGS